MPLFLTKFCFEKIVILYKLLFMLTDNGCIIVICKSFNKYVFRIFLCQLLVQQISIAIAIQTKALWGLNSSLV